MNENAENTRINPPSFEATVGGSYSYGWKMLMKHFVDLLLVTIIVIVINIPFHIFRSSYEIGGIGFPIVVFFGFFTLVYGIFIVAPIEYGADWMFLKAMRNEKFEIKDMFSSFEIYLKVILANILVAVIVIMGMIALLIPGIIFACKLAFVPYLVMDRKLDPGEAIKESWRMTKGHAWTIFFMGVLAFFIIIAGLVCCIVGVVPAAMWVSSAFASLYYAVSSEEQGAVDIKQ